MCHSHLDKVLVQGLVTLLDEAGWRAYVDWTDPEMPASPNRETASRIDLKIRECDFFLFLATSNSMGSRWCPWEIGLAHGTKQNERIVICPTSEGSTTHGNEYLDLYRRLELSDLRQLAVWQPGDTRNGVLIAQL